MVCAARIVVLEALLVRLVAWCPRGVDVLLGILQLVMYVCMVKFVTGLWPRSLPSMGHLPLSDFWSSCCSSVNLRLWRWVLNLAV